MEQKIIDGNKIYAKIDRRFSCIYTTIHDHSGRVMYRFIPVESVEPSDNELSRDGFLPCSCQNEKPEIGVGNKLVYKMSVTGGFVTKEYVVLPADAELPEDVLAPRKFSKLSIYGAIVSLPERNGVTAWEQVKEWLESKTINGVNGWMAFQLAQEISENHPLFVPLASEAKILLGLTDEQFENLLNACILTE